MYMQRRHERRMYPPRVKMTVSLTSPTITFKLGVRFSGTVSDDEMDTELAFPLGKL